MGRARGDVLYATIHAAYHPPARRDRAVKHARSARSVAGYARLHKDPYNLVNETADRILVANCLVTRPYNGPHWRS